MSTYRAPADGERVDELVAGWAEATPSAKAVVCGARRIGYGELGRLVDAEADRLRSAGLPEGGLVAVALDRSVAALVAMLGVLRAKGAYLPLDPAMPDAELHRVLEEAGPHVVLTRESYRAKVGGRPGRRVVCVDAEAEPGGGGARPRGEVDAPPTGGGTACVFLTAGTTGRPRLVRVGHHDLAAARNAWQQVHGFDARDRHVHTAPPESPEFTANWVRALCSGGTLVLPADDDPPAPGARLAALRRLLTTEAATVLACGVPTARLLSTRRPFGSTRLRLVTVTGDVWYLDEQRALRDALGGDVRVVNAYTVTEAFGAGTCFELPAGRDPSAYGDDPVSLVGVPLPGTRLTVEGPGPGRRGPILLNGVHTGDEGRVRDDGVLEFLGRRGSHAAAERALHGHPDVREGLVAEVETDHPRRTALRAYAVPVPGRSLDPADVHRYLCSRLGPGDGPRPHAVVPVKRLPRTRADRVDRGNLPLPVGPGPLLGKKGAAAESRGIGCTVLAALVLVPFFAVLAWVLTDALWPFSTDLSGVPVPYSDYFRGLYFWEYVSFGAGVAFLVVGRPGLDRIGHGHGFTTLAHLSVSWLLAAWWPQDNSYRLTDKTDWHAQAVLVYTFNVSLMIAAFVVAAFLLVPPGRRRPGR